MTQKTSPFLESKYGWSYGENGWNTGMDENLVKFSFMFDRNVDAIVSSLPAVVNGTAYYLTTDNRFYFGVDNSWYSSPVPKYFQFQIKSTGIVYQFNGTSVSPIPSTSSLATRLDSVELIVDDLGTASTYDESYFAKNSDFVNYKNLISSDQGAGEVNYNIGLTGSVQKNLQDFIESRRVSVTEFGSVGTADDSVTIQKAIDSGKPLWFPPGLYKINVTVNSAFNWKGAGNTKTIFQPVNVSLPIVKNMYYEPEWQFCYISDIGFEGLGTRTGVGFSYGDPSGYTTGAEFIGRVVMDRVSFKNLDKGIFKTYGNIGNVYSDCSFLYNNYGSYARGAQFANPSSSMMQSTNDTFNQGEAHGNEIAAFAYIDTTLPLGHVTFNQTTIQFNKGFGLFMSTASAANAVHPIIFNNVWDEANGTAYPGQSTHTVTIDTITGPQVLSPKGIQILGGLRGFVGLGLPGSVNSLNTRSTNGVLSIWGDQRNSLNLISGFGDGANSWTQIGFASEGTETTNGAYIRSNNVSGTGRNIQFYTNNGTAIPLTLNINGSTQIGTQAAQFGSPAAGTHQIWGDTSTAGSQILEVGARFSSKTNFYTTDGADANTALSGLRISKVNSTGRSINASGTINAAGADYAEYENNNGLVIAKGDVVGFKKDGTLTLKYSESVRFAVKSTNPGIVGGDTWGVNFPEKEDITEEEMVALKEQQEIARKNVDRIAYAGKVPLNISSAKTGAYAVVSQGENDSIEILSIENPSYEQYLKSVGRIGKRLNKTQFEITVITH